MNNEKAFAMVLSIFVLAVGITLVSQAWGAGLPESECMKKHYKKDNSLIGMSWSEISSHLSNKDKISRIKVNNKPGYSYVTQEGCTLSVLVDQKEVTEEVSMSNECCIAYEDWLKNHHQRSPSEASKALQDSNSSH